MRASAEPAHSNASGATPPCLVLFVLEPMRAALEYAGLRRMDRTALPAGDGHPVIVFPGLANSERAVGPLIAFCRSLGHAARGWGRGYNLGPSGDLDAWLDALAEDTAAVAREAGRPVSLVGWSLGGIYAREIAKLRPDAVRQVITLGAPFATAGGDTRVGWLYRLLSRQPAAPPADLAARLRTPPPVPCTSVYSRSDGIVAWRTCRDAAARLDARQENVEIDGSHLGMGWNPRVLAVVADRLAQPPGTWRPYGTAPAAQAADAGTGDAALAAAQAAVPAAAAEATGGVVATAALDAAAAQR